MKQSLLLILTRSALALALMTILTGFLYPLLVTGIGKVFWAAEADGSLILKDGTLVGSELLAQGFSGPGYFWPRPSAVNYGTVPGGPSNHGPTASKLNEAIAKRREAFGDGLKAPYDLLMTSGSGLDPHIRPQSALYQIPRVAAQTGLSEATLQELVKGHTEGRTFGLLGKERVNVLKLNLALRNLTP